MGVERGTFNDVAKECTYNAYSSHVNCTAFEYSASRGYGYLCTPDYYEMKEETSDDFQICIKKGGSV